MARLIETTKSKFYRIPQGQDIKSRENAELDYLKDQIERLKNDNLNLFEAYFSACKERLGLTDKLKRTLQKNNRLKLENRALKRNRDHFQKQLGELSKKTADPLTLSNKNETQVDLTIMAPIPKR